MVWKHREPSNTSPSAALTKMRNLPENRNETSLHNGMTVPPFLMAHRACHLHSRWIRAFSDDVAGLSADEFANAPVDDDAVIDGKESPSKSGLEETR